MISTICLSTMLACSTSNLYVPKEASEQSISSFQTLPQTTDEIIRIYFLRNGETDFSAKNENGNAKITSGRSPSIPLNQRGIEQALALKEALSSKIQNAAIFIPPAVRAEETAQMLLSDEIAMGGIYDGLLEVGMGDWEGKPKDQLYYDNYQKWIDLPAEDKFVSAKVETGESYFEASERALKDLTSIIEGDSEKTLFIVSGDNILNALAIRWMHPELSRQPRSELPRLPLGNCELYMIELPRGERIENASLKLILHLN